ncbi:unnamed protein product [Rhizoctonia solani]|uniref:ATP-dependent RNA helicase n=1 Tax=Rhizoctonia solani TaxID=456999 RepID=A0A8H3CVA7_9AGAM|nr:unnamed protein product [Rhizoctonia solani]
MSHTEEYDPPSRRDSNNATPRSSQNKSKILEATMRNVPKLKELNYAHWKNVITNSIKNAKLWGYVDGSIVQPLEEDAADLAKYFEESGAVQNAILGSLESGAQKYIEEALDPRDAWLTLEKKYLTAEADPDSKLGAIEKQLVDLRLEEGGDMIEHIAEFCRMRSHLSGTRLALDDQASISMLYRSLPPGYRQSAVTPDGTEMKDFGALCARLSYLSQNTEPRVSVDGAPTEDYINWGVPGDIKAFGLTGDKNPLLAERAMKTCRDCLLKGHKARTPECPQYEWRKELWGMELNEQATGNSGKDFATKLPVCVNSRLSYEFSEPVKVILNFNELDLKPKLREQIGYSPSAIQQCAILPITQGRNVLALAPARNGKTTALAISILQIIDTSLPYVQALVFTSTDEDAIAFQKTVNHMGSKVSARCSSDGTRLVSLAEVNNHHIFVGEPAYLLRLVHRNIINMRNLRTVVLDDIDKLIEAKMQDRILEVYRHVPPLAQVIASSTTLSPLNAHTISTLLADPLRISVAYSEGISIRTHLYVKVPLKQKPKAFDTLFSAFGVYGVVTLGISATGFVNIGAPIINYDIPRNTEEYIRLLDQWRVAYPAQRHMVITFVDADSDEMHVIWELEQHHGIHFAELIWDGENNILS